MSFLKTMAATAALSVAATAASAVTVTITEFDATDFAAFQNALDTSTVEDFEGFAVGEYKNPAGVSTDVGTFTSLGGTGTGGTVTGSGFPNDGEGLTIREGSVFGRTNTTPGGSKFLDSNDTFGMLWDVVLAGNAVFDRIGFTLSDSTDQGATLQVSVDGTMEETIVGKGNANVQFVLVKFDTKVSGAELKFTNINKPLNDGFSIDDATVGTVPLPAAGWMLLAGLGGLAAARRRKS